MEQSIQEDTEPQVGSSESIEIQEKKHDSAEESEQNSPEKKLKKDDINESENDDLDAEDSKSKKKKSIPGVIYLSRIPTKMNVKIIREYFSQFGEVDRIYLEPQEKKRKNQQRSFSEGWVEFKKRKIAKQIANELNNTQIGGKRRNPWFSELWNIKYLKNFRWTHLNERLAYEQEVRKQRLRQEITLAKKEANFYIQNVEKNEKRKRFEKKMSKETPQEENRVTPIVEANPKIDEEEKPFVKNKHPVFERKVKVAGNETFLKQIFS